MDFQRDSFDITRVKYFISDDVTFSYISLVKIRFLGSIIISISDIAQLEDVVKGQMTACYLFK